MISSGSEVRQVPGGEEGNAAELGLEQDQREVNICSRLGLFSSVSVSISIEHCHEVLKYTLLVNCVCFNHLNICF